MSKQRFNPERDLRAWADALNAVADLQAAIVEQAHEMTMLDREGIEWLEPFRAVVALPWKIVSDPIVNKLEAANALKQDATEALELLQKQAKERQAKK